MINAYNSQLPCHTRTHATRCFTANSLCTKEDSIQSVSVLNQAYTATVVSRLLATLVTIDGP